MKAYSCPSCGAELICDAEHGGYLLPLLRQPNGGAGAVCGNAEAGFRDPLQTQPRGRHPASSRSITGARCSFPRAFPRKITVQEIQGVYVPFWLFSGEAEGDAHYECYPVPQAHRG